MQLLRERSILFRLHINTWWTKNKTTENRKNSKLSGTKNKTEIQGYLGLINWCSKYNVELMEIKPLYELTYDGVKFKMKTKYIQTFEE